jgi:hypothetical protein
MAARRTWATLSVLLCGPSAIGCANVLGLESSYSAPADTGGSTSGGGTSGSGGSGTANGGSASGGGSGGQASTSLVATQLSAGSAHACARRPNGTIACWGGFYPDTNQPPSGTFDVVVAGVEETCALNGGYATCWGAYPTVNSPPNQVFSSLSVGNQFACGPLESTGEVLCWGDYPPPTPSGAFSQVASGGDFVCARAGDGSVQCTADGAFGPPVPPSDGFAALAAGTTSVCGLLASDHTLSCFTDASSTVIAAIPTGPFQSVSLSSNSVGNDAACALRESGDLVCFGDTSSGIGAPPAGTFSAVSVGGDFACALDGDGRVRCWGDSLYGGASPPSQ